MILILQTWKEQDTRNCINDFNFHTNAKSSCMKGFTHAWKNSQKIQAFIEQLNELNQTKSNRRKQRNISIIDNLPCNDGSDQQQHLHCWNLSPVLQKICSGVTILDRFSISLLHLLQQILIITPGRLVIVSHIVGPRWPSLTAPSYC